MLIPAHIQKAIQAYYAERATPDDVAALEDWFRKDIAHIRIFAEHGMIEWHMLCETEKADAAAILTMLREAEENAEPDFSLLHAPAFASTPATTVDNALTLHELWSVASYALAKALHTRAAAIGAIAAVLVIGAALYLAIVGIGGPEDQRETADNTPSMPAESAPSIPRDHPVATLTATHNATWAGAASAAPAPGDPLHPNQRLTLTTGFAEITTARGAIAILEAPATIELLDNDNALRLHTGKLVGICETESSKGFLVRTPHMDVTDLGTRFGVDASSPQATTVHVYQGEVELSRPSRDGIAAPQTLHLIQGQAAGVTQAGEYQRLQADTTPFAAIKPTVTQLPGSGAGIERGEEDARWTVVTVDGETLASPHVLRVSTDHDSIDGLQLDPSIAQWLAWDPRHKPTAQGYNTYRFETALDLPASLDPRTSTLVLDYFADTRIRGIWINGQQVIDAPGGKNDHIGKNNANGTRRIILDQGLIPGQNLIQIDVENHLSTGGGHPAAVGLIASWELHEHGTLLNE